MKDFWWWPCKSGKKKKKKPFNDKVSSSYIFCGYFKKYFSFTGEYKYIQMIFPIINIQLDKISTKQTFGMSIQNKNLNCKYLYKYKIIWWFWSWLAKFTLYSKYLIALCRFLIFYKDAKYLNKSAWISGKKGAMLIFMLALLSKNVLLIANAFPQIHTCTSTLKSLPSCPSTAPALPAPIPEWASFPVSVLRGIARSTIISCVCSLVLRNPLFALLLTFISGSESSSWFEICFSS